MKATTQEVIEANIKPFTLKELLNWCIQAQVMHEASWHEPSRSYTVPLKTAVTKTTPDKAKQDVTMAEIAYTLTKNMWNEVQEWVKTIN